MNMRFRSNKSMQEAYEKAVHCDKTNASQSSAKKRKAHPEARRRSGREKIRSSWAIGRKKFEDGNEAGEDLVSSSSSFPLSLLLLSFHLQRYFLQKVVKKKKIGKIEISVTTLPTCWARVCRNNKLKVYSSSVHHSTFMTQGKFLSFSLESCQSRKMPIQRLFILI